MKQQRLHKRFSAKLPVTLDVITANRLKVFNAETKDISANGAFLYTEEAAFIPDDTRFILNVSNPENRRIRWKKLRPTQNCIGTMVRSTPEGIAIRFNKPVELFY